MILSCLFQSVDEILKNRKIICATIIEYKECDLLKLIREGGG